MMGGQSPRILWQSNADGSRTIEEAMEIARRNGVLIPEDVVFLVDEWGELNHLKTARGPYVKQRPSGAKVTWNELLNIHNKVVFKVRPDIFESDEAIVGVFAHELFELAKLRPLLMEGISIDFLFAETCPNNPGNYHDQAWDFADELVAQMRKNRS